MTTETDGQTAAPEATAVETEEAPAEVEQQQSEATTDDDNGEESTAETSEPKKPAKGVQKRLDELTRLRHDAERDRDYWRELAMASHKPTPQPTPQHTEGPPREDQFADWDEYQQALIDYRVEQRLQAVKEQEQRSSVLRTYEERAAKLREAKPDYDSVVTDPSLTITPLMAEVIRESEVGPEVAYHLGTNRSEAKRIAALPPHRQAAELGRLEVKLTLEAAKPTPAPPRPIPPSPPQTVAGLSAGLNKAPEEMSMAEYVAWRQAGNS